MARVLVTGGAGYIGSHAVRALVDAGHTIAVLDDLSAGHAAAVPPGVPLVRCGMHDTRRVAEALATHRADAVMHFAAWLDVAGSVSNPVGYYHNNVTGTLSVLDAMRQMGVRQFIFSSTCATYGEPTRVPMDETLDPRPINAYGETKLAVERALPHLERAHGIRFIALRYFNAAGAHPDGTLGEDHDPEIHLIPRALQAATGGPPLKVFGEDYPTPDGTCLRDYIHVCDLADAHVLALDALTAGAASGGVQRGHRHAALGALGHRHGLAGGGAEPCAGNRRRAARAIPQRSMRRAIGSRARWAGGRDYPDLDAIVQNAWRWHAAHPEGYKDRAQPV